MILACVGTQKHRDELALAQPIKTITDVGFCVVQHQPILDFLVSQSAFIPSTMP